MFWEMAVIKENDDGWMDGRTDFIPVRLAFPRLLLLCYIMTKSLIIPLRLNHVYFFAPRASSALVYQWSYTSPAESAQRGSGRSAKSSILRVYMCVSLSVCVGGHVRWYVCAAWFSYNFKSSFGCAC